MTNLSEDQLDYVHCVVDLKLSASDIVEQFGRHNVELWQYDREVKAEITKRRRQRAEQQYLKKQLDLDAILDLRPLALDSITRVLRSKDHPDQIKVALKILQGEFSMIDQVGKLMAEKKVSEIENQGKNIKLIYDRRDKKG